MFASLFDNKPDRRGQCLFVYSATVEEHYLPEQFPDTYPVYKRSTKMLVPFIFWVCSLGFVPSRTASERDGYRYFS